MPDVCPRRVGPTRGAPLRGAAGAGSARRAQRRARTAWRRVGADSGVTTSRSPNFARLLGRRSGWATERSSPVRPTSPKHAERRASPPPARAPRRAGDGERDGQVGARLVEAHAADDVDEHVGRPDADPGVAAEDREDEREAVAVDPVATRRGGTSSLGETRAWTSTSSGREPSIEASTTLPGARVASATKRALASRTSTSPPVAHLEDADLARRAEAVLQRADRAVGPLALALELHDAVDQVLEHPRARQRPLLRDVADEHDRGARALGHRHDPRGDLAHLPDAPGRAAELAARAASGPSRSRRPRAARPRAWRARRRGRSRPARARRAPRRRPASRSRRRRICAADSSPLT